jgi:hypothetical protein
MFRDSQFNQDISKWNVINVVGMESMFTNSKFNQDISNWKTINVVNMDGMFCGTDFPDEYKPPMHQKDSTTRQPCNIINVHPDGRAGYYDTATENFIDKYCLERHNRNTPADARRILQDLYLNACTRCENSIGLVKCDLCKNCLYCEDCFWCTDCEDCFGCTDCVNCICMVDSIALVDEVVEDEL